MEQNERDRIAAELAVEYRDMIRDSAAAEQLNRPGGGRSMGLAYFFWFSFGTFGAHRFYLGRPLSGAGMLVLGIFAALLSLQSLLIFGSLLGGALAVWWLIDAFLIPGMLADY
jgi:TM2 domain-containing membrane protein YozV